MSNPTGVALARRTVDLLNGGVLPGPDPIVFTQPETGFRPLFDGTAGTFKNWRLAGPGGGGMLHVNGEMVSYGGGSLRLLFYATELFGNFTLRTQFRIFDTANHNSGVFVRFPRPSLDLSDALGARSANETLFDTENPAWKPVISGFEVQIDDNARGDARKDFYGVQPEPDGLFKNRTGAIYKIQARDRVWHLGFNEPAVQTYNPGPALIPGVWFEYEIVVQGDDYTVFLTNLESGQRIQTTSFHNTDTNRGGAPGCIGIQAYPGSTVAWRHNRIKTPSGLTERRMSQRRSGLD
jgi:hypothetical protein